ncbi:MAG TPA: HAD family hydrolase [Anaerolineales bacterium]|nr:HAD family hydrolase [Anaerolineae bacterium]HIQ02765.1 HAD family hydrolase [Anaerolineales bacterium]
MIRAILMDLDNTLLENDMDRFVPAYLAALSEYMSGLFPPEIFVRHLMQATNAMLSNTDTSRTNMEAFDAAFFPALGRGRSEMEPLFDTFYATRFPQLRELTRPNPASRPLLEWAFAQGFQIAVATNPLFPRTAIEQRLAWAGVPVGEFPYHLVTSYEDMHATKPHPAYFLEIARRLGRRPEECLMVGDEWRLDIHPALGVGMQAYWIADPDELPPVESPTPAGVGRLSDFARWIQTIPPPGELVVK